MNEVKLTQEQRVMRMMRKVLTKIVREITPQPGMRHPLSEGTINDIRDCLALISAREGELADEAGIPRTMRPVFIDEPQKAQVVPMPVSRKSKADDEKH
jgi:hypothetical protein